MTHVIVAICLALGVARKFQRLLVDVPEFDHVIEAAIEAENPRRVRVVHHCGRPVTRSLENLGQVVEIRRPFVVNREGAVSRRLQ